MSADLLLSKLDGVKRTGQGRWIARCPAHADKRPSLSVRELDDGRVLVHDFAGCGAHEIVSAVGLQITDLFPPRPDDPAHVGKPERRPFPATDILRAIAFEALLVSQEVRIARTPARPSTEPASDSGGTEAAGRS